MSSMTKLCEEVYPHAAPTHRVGQYVNRAQACFCPCWSPRVGLYKADLQCMQWCA